MLKEKLIFKLLKQPDEFTENDLDRLLRPENPKEKITTEELTKITRRIFDINENTFLNKSEADIGILGKLNKRSRRKRNRKYFKRIRKGFRTNPNNKIILAEGDSWFEFPVFIKDIIDFLSKRKDYAIYSLAYGGDWLSNIMYQGEYIEGLPVHTPDAFLISGGGNDMIGGNRLTTMLVNPVRERNKLITPSSDYIQYVNSRITNSEKANEILEGKRYLTGEFTSLINVIRLQYELMFSNIISKYPDLIIITQGYDCAVPSAALHFGFNPLYWHQPLLNYLTNNGHWLFESFMMKAIADPALQAMIIKTMIFDFNEMLIKIATKPDYRNVFHIDCRGACRNNNDWYDELHPKSRIFKRIAKLYQDCIDHKTTSKVISLK
jgi:hypothetical protein